MSAPWQLLVKPEAFSYWGQGEISEVNVFNVSGIDTKQIYLNDTREIFLRHLAFSLIWTGEIVDFGKRCTWQSKEFASNFIFKLTQFPNKWQDYWRTGRHFDFSMDLRWWYQLCWRVKFARASVDGNLLKLFE